jgi:hypothetical protein
MTTEKGRARVVEDEEEVCSGGDQHREDEDVREFPESHTAGVEEDEQ